MALVSPLFPFDQFYVNAGDSLHPFLHCILLPDRRGVYVSEVFGF